MFPQCDTEKCKRPIRLEVLQSLNAFLLINMLVLVRLVIIYTKLVRKVYFNLRLLSLLTVVPTPLTHSLGRRKGT